MLRDAPVATLMTWSSQLGETTTARRGDATSTGRVVDAFGGRRPRCDDAVGATQAVPRSLVALALRQEGLVSAGQCADASVTAGQRARRVHSGEWRRATHGVYDLTPTVDRRSDADGRRRRAAWLGMLAHGPTAVAVGSCALALHGVRGLPASIVPEVALPSTHPRRVRDGIRVRQFREVEAERFGSRAVSALVPALAQSVPELPRDNAIAVLDDVLFRGLLTGQSLDEVRQRVLGRRGSSRCAEWWDLVDPGAESPLETFARLQCIDAGVAPDRLQVEIRDDDGRFLGRGDLGWQLGGDRWLIAEIDGREFHETPDAVLHDRRRQNALLATGRVELLRFTSADIAARTVIPTAIRAALTRRPTMP
ncbi:hypothetical protein ASD16_16095 [Cellulomonas sp. Root485]|nr:hypothetical protein ASD16_16095 [Cellulomonas sp. Root485]